MLSFSVGWQLTIQRSRIALETAADQCMQSWQTQLFKNKDCVKMSLDGIAVVYYAKNSFCGETNDSKL